MGEAIACFTPTARLRHIVRATMLMAMVWVVLGCCQTMALQRFGTLRKSPSRQCAVSINVQAIMQVHLNGGAMHGWRVIRAVIGHMQPIILTLLSHILCFLCEVLGTECILMQVANVCVQHSQNC